jgi:fatty acid desaturase
MSSANSIFNIERHFRDKEGVKYNLMAFGFTFIGYLMGVMWLFSSHFILNILGVLLTAEALIISAYLLHEFSHYSIFKTPQMNALWGNIMSWMNGSCYGTFEEIRNKHMRHHIDRADVVSFDMRRFIENMPTFFKAIVKALEWLYIPVAEMMMHFFVIYLPFVTPKWHHKRTRTAVTLLIRTSIFMLIFIVSPKAWFLYALAYCIMLTALRFADTYQHTYDVFMVDDASKKDKTFEDDGKLRDEAYEQANTYSNLASIHHPWVNLLFLNFPYHNAHHVKPIVPWYQLPRFHRELFGQNAVATPVIPMLYCLKSFHKHRLARLESEGYGVIESKAGGADNFVGVVGVSFLTAI